jgi:F0F1-type ATP synthase assembly protein I
MAVTCPTNDSFNICSLMDSMGSGLGIFFEKIAQSLPVLLLVLAVITIVVAVGMAVANVIKKGIQGGGRHY